MKYFIPLLLLTARSLFCNNETSHVTVFDHKIFYYKAKISSIPLPDAKGEIHYTYYKEEGNDTKEERPLTFVFNGGPGSSSVWLHMGAFGPKRVLSYEETGKNSPPFHLIENSDSILPWTDLVFIDPIGTGFSTCSEQSETSYFTVQGDIQSFSDFICSFLTQEGLWNAPKYLAGESYGALRACGLALDLFDRHRISLNGLIFISPALDYKTIFAGSDNELPLILYLPSYAATAWKHDRLPNMTLQEAIAQAKTFAFETLAPELLQTGHIPHELFESLAKWTGLPFSFIEKQSGWIAPLTYFQAFCAEEKKLLSRFDSRVMGPLCPHISSAHYSDPFFSYVSAAFASSWQCYLQNDLEVKTAAHYELLSRSVNEQWEYRFFGYPSQMDALRKISAGHPDLRIFSASGYYDLATPFTSVEYCLNRLHMQNKHITHCTYDGGHMFYTNPEALKAFRDDLKEFYSK